MRPDVHRRLHLRGVSDHVMKVASLPGPLNGARECEAEGDGMRGIGGQQQVRPRQPDTLSD
eukprot:6067223-Alexandrium_andersonii.AAC.1